MSAPSETPATASQRQSLQHNWEDWLPYLEDEDIPEAKKHQLIDTLWSIIIAFVDLGWEIAPDTPSQETSGQVLDLRAALEAAVLNSEQPAKEEV